MGDVLGRDHLLPGEGMFPPWRGTHFGNNVAHGWRWNIFTIRNLPIDSPDGSLNSVKHIYYLKPFMFLYEILIQYYAVKFAKFREHVVTIENPNIKIKIW